MFGFPCDSNNCNCIDCDCTDPYDTAGTGGASTNCPFTGGATLVIASGVLEGVAGNTIVFTNGPDDNITVTTILTISCKPDDSDGPSSIELRAGIQGGVYVYGRLTTDGSGNVVLSVGTSGGELAQNDEAGTGGISGFVELKLCWDPSMPGDTVDSIDAGADNASDSGGSGFWNDLDNVLGYNDDTYAWHGPLAAGNVSNGISISYFPYLPPNSTPTGFAGEVRCRQVADPGNDPEVFSAVFSAGGSSSANLAASESVPSPNFGTLSWGGEGNLLGISTTAEAINTSGIGFAISFEFTVDNDGDIDIDHILATVWFETEDRTPGRITFSYNNGVVLECISVLTTAVGGGGFPGLSFITDNWEVTTTQIQCTDSECPECTEPFDCDTGCCDEAGKEGFTEELMISGFTLGSSVNDCCGSVDYTLQANASPGGECSWLYLTDCDGDGATHVRAYILQLASGCYWEATISCFDGLDLALFVRYRSAVIVSQSCDEFPITLSKVFQLGSPTAPSTITLDNV